MKRRDRMKLTAKTMLLGYKLDLEERGEIPKMGKLKHLEGQTYYAEKRKRNLRGKYDMTRYIFRIDGYYRKSYVKL